jgi:hypothetical protein
MLKDICHVWWGRAVLNVFSRFCKVGEVGKEINLRQKMPLALRNPL